ncbi:hypothetical protein HGB44_24530 [Nocardiopsis dassonvillei subsp. albirubida]|uniref:Uncharacterized protein n=2 Tax=Nocardiopsis alborubida TaxID=146802 RepID=A0A7X6RSA2_9ACTN|nr:hypothetical protein [Nocardiopsis alborubida]
MQRRFVFSPLFLTLGTLGLAVLLGTAFSSLVLSGPEFANLASGFFGLVLAALGTYGTFFQKAELPSPPEKAPENDSGTPEDTRSDSHVNDRTNIAVSTNNNSHNTTNSHNNNGKNSGGVILGAVAMVAIVAIIVALALVFFGVVPVAVEGEATADTGEAVAANTEQSACDAPVPLGPDPLELRSATVVYTEGLGVKARCGPHVTYPASDQQNLFDHVHVNIVCQVRNGYPVKDPRNEEFPAGYPRESTVWNLLHDGRWVSDLYVDTPKVEGSDPPEGYESCDGLVRPV